MEIVYRAKDGKEFDSAEKCDAYEKLLEIGIEMYDRAGRRTTDVQRAMVINLKDYDQAEEFIELSRYHRVKSDGITLVDTGWFYWDGRRYQPISSGAVKIFRHLQDLTGDK